MLFCPMTAEDGPALLKFAQALPKHDILYMRRDITRQEGVDRWLRELNSGRIHSLIALVDGELAGYSTINLTKLDWTRHVGEIRVSVSLSARKSV